MTNKLFEPVTIGKLALANRIVMAPLTRNRSPESIPNDLNRTYYVQRATAGLIITEATAISQQGQGYIDVPGLYKSEQIAGWRRITDAVHEAGGKIFTQLWHVGRISHTSLQPGGKAPVAPSAIRANARTFIRNSEGKGEFVEASQPRALKAAEFEGIINDYCKAAYAAVQDAGFDGIEIHMANGYLLDSFLRRGSNQRKDNYGGSIENRMRFPLEVVEAVTTEIGEERTGLRISPVTPANDAHDSNPQPLFDALVAALAAYDLAYIHVLEGATAGDRDYQEADYPFDYHHLKQAYSDAGGEAAWMVNNGYNRAMAIEAVDSGYADLVAFGRPFIANPDLVRRFKENKPLNPVHDETNYGGGAKGYTDYPALG